MSRRGLSHQSSGIKQLKGGSQALNDPIANMLANVSRLVDASLKNNAALKAVRALPDYFQELGDQDKKTDAVRVVDDGRRSEARRVGKECGRPCSTRGSPYHKKNNTKIISKQKT